MPPRRPMRTGWSLYDDEEDGRVKERCEQARVSDTNLAADILDPWGNKVSLQAFSTDGIHYDGHYRYAQPAEDCPPGTASFERSTDASGDVFIGTWQDNQGRTGRWKIKIEA